MQIITLTTDWGLSDYYVGVVKGRLYSMIHDVLVVDITHSICDYDIVKTAFIVKNACCEFPEGSIHIIDVNSYEQGETNYSKARPYLAVKHNNQFYICTDDGSEGFKGLVTAMLEKLVNEDGKVYDQAVAIGPMIMMKFATLSC